MITANRLSFTNSRTALLAFLMLIGASIGVIFMLFTASPAHANPGGGTGDPPIIDVGGGSETPPATGVGTDNPDTPQPSGGSSGYRSPFPTQVFTVGCENWNGAGSWRMSANCAISDGRAYDSGPPTNRGWGSGTRSDGFPYSGTTSMVGTPGCAPDGSRSAYAQNFQQVQIEERTTTFGYRWNRDFGWVRFVSSNQATGLSVVYTALNCLYPETRYSNVTCFWNYNGDSKYSINRTSGISSWEHFGTRGRISGDPNAPTGGSGTTAPNCDRTGSANVRYQVNVDELGYYRMYVNWNYRTYTKEAWVIWGNQEVYQNWTSGSTLAGSATTWWTYSCRPGAPTNALQGPFSTQGALPDIDRYTNPANCPQVTWQCALDTPTTVGLDRSAVTSGRVSPTTSTSVMRNGEQVDVDFASVRVIDTSTSRDIDVTNGGTAPSIRNLTNIGYQTNVKDGSTPFYGKDPNASNQYFKMYGTRGSETKERFNAWLNNNNANRNKALSFNWASESTSDKFAVQRTYRVTAEFYVPAGGSIGTSGAGVTNNYKWLTGTYNCRDYDGRGTSRVDRGVLTSTSNPVEVIRSVNR